MPILQLKVTRRLSASNPQPTAAAHAGTSSWLGSVCCSAHDNAHITAHKPDGGADAAAHSPALTISLSHLHVSFYQEVYSSDYNVEKLSFALKDVTGRGSQVWYLQMLVVPAGFEAAAWRRAASRVCANRGRTCGCAV